MSQSSAEGNLLVVPTGEDHVALSPSTYQERPCTSESCLGVASWLGPPPDSRQRSEAFSAHRRKPRHFAGLRLCFVRVCS